MLAHGLRMFRNPVGPVSALDSVAFVAEPRPLLLRVTRVAVAGVLLESLGVYLDPVVRMRGHHAVAVVAGTLIVTSRAAIPALLLYLKFVSLHPFRAERSHSTAAERLMARTTCIRSRLAIVTLEACLHRRDVLSRRPAPMHQPGMARETTDIPIPMLFVGDLQSVIDYYVAGFGVTRLTVFICDSAVRLGGVAGCGSFLVAHSPQLHFDHPGPAWHLMTLVA